MNPAAKSRTVQHEHTKDSNYNHHKSCAIAYKLERRLSKMLKLLRKRNCPKYATG